LPTGDLPSSTIFQIVRLQNPAAAQPDFLFIARSEKQS
jgi:hypothetical protein